MRLELFVRDLDRFVDFYTGILGFVVADDRRRTDHPYVAVVNGSAVVGASVAWDSVDQERRSVPQGVEIVLDVDDVHAVFRAVDDSDWPVSDTIQRRSWGLTDFRVHDPDGHYIRITSRPGSDRFVSQPGDKHTTVSSAGPVRPCG